MYSGRPLAMISVKMHIRHGSHLQLQGSPLPRAKGVHGKTPPKTQSRLDDIDHVTSHNVLFSCRSLPFGPERACQERFNLIGLIWGQAGLKRRPQLIVSTAVLSTRKKMENDLYNRLHLDLLDEVGLVFSDTECTFLPTHRSIVEARPLVD